MGPLCPRAVGDTILQSLRDPDDFPNKSTQMAEPTAEKSSGVPGDYRMRDRSDLGSDSVRSQKCEVEPDVLEAFAVACEIGFSEGWRGCPMGYTENGLWHAKPPCRRENWDRPP